jgi:flagellar basal body-associated protein FliL
MKISNRGVSVIVTVAVLVATCAVGLLVRGMRTSQGPSDAAPAPVALPPRGPGERPTRDTAAEMARLTEQRAQRLKKMDSMTDEQKEQFRAQIREHFSSRRADGLSPRQQEALKAQILARMQAGQQGQTAPPTPADANASQEQSTGRVEDGPDEAGPR